MDLSFLLLSAELSELTKSASELAKHDSLVIWILGSANTLLVTVLILALTNFNRNFHKLVNTVDKIVVMSARSDEQIKTLFNSNINAKKAMIDLGKKVDMVWENQLKCKSCDIN